MKDVETTAAAQLDSGLLAQAAALIGQFPGLFRQIKNLLAAEKPR